MSGLTNPRGPLPAAVYWRRRALLIVVALLLLFGLIRLVGGGSDEAVTRTRQTPTPAPSVTAPVVTPSATGGTPSPSASPTQIVIPSGECDPIDVTVESQVEDPRGGGDVEFVLLFGTKDGSACTFDVSARTISVRLTSGEDFIWSSQDCPRSVVPTQVVASSKQPGEVSLVWNGRRSDNGCGRLSGWALPGYYHIEAAALGGDPSDVQFELGAPEQQTTILRPFSPEARELQRQNQGSDETD